MKIQIVILAVLGLACGKSIPTRTLQDDLNDLLALIPLDELLGIALDYLANDEQVQETVIYLQADEFHKIVLTIEGLQETKNLLQFVNDLGVDVYSILNTLHDIIDLPPYQPSRSTRKGVGLNGLIDDIFAILPTDALQALYNDKLQNSPDFQALVAALQGPEFATILETLRALPEYQGFLQFLSDKDVDVDRIIALFKALLGISRQGTGTRTLQEDMDDFVALVPLDAVLTVALDYLANDQEVQDFMVYLQSDPFYKIIGTVEALQQFKDFLVIINDLGIDVYSIINTIHDILGLPPYVPKHNTRLGVGISGLLNDELALLPLDDLKALFEQKKQTSADFQAVVSAIQSPNFAVIVDTLHGVPEYNALLNSLRDKGVDVDSIIAALRHLFDLPTF